MYNTCPFQINSDCLLLMGIFIYLFEQKQEDRETDSERERVEVKRETERYIKRQRQGTE